MEDDGAEATAAENVQEVLKGLSSRSEEALSAGLIGMRRLLEGSNGGEVLRNYVVASPKCIELVNAWAGGPRAATALQLLRLLVTILRHPAGLSDKKKKKNAGATFEVRLDKIAQWLVSQCLTDVYSHLSSGHRARQSAALRLMAAIVERGRHLATQVASTFDFGLDALQQVSKHHHRRGGKGKNEGNGDGFIARSSTRAALVEFGMAFLLVGDAALLRRVLQKRSLYAGLLHGLASDPSETITRVLVLFKYRVLNSDSGIPQGIRVALFGDAALEQLTRISSEVDSEEGQLAHELLLRLATDPAHGICPADSSSLQTGKNRGQYGGGAGRLLRMMLHLRAAELQSHRELLLAIATARPVLAAAFLDEYPYSLEPRQSPRWFSAMSLVSTLIAIASAHDPFAAVAEGRAAPPRSSPLVQSALRRVWPQKLSRALFNRCFVQTAQPLVKHFGLKLLLEVLVGLERLLGFVQQAGKSSESQLRAEWLNLGTFVQDRARSALPECSTLLLLLVHDGNNNNNGDEGKIGSKRKRTLQEHKQKKKQKIQFSEEEQLPIIDEDEEEESQDRLVQLWGSDVATVDEAETILHTKVLQALALYQRTMPLALRDINFDAFKHVPDDPESLSPSQQDALSDLLLSAARHSPTSSGPATSKSLKLLMKLLLHARTPTTRSRVQLLLDRALRETGAFDGNPHEVTIWLHSLPAWYSDSSGVQDGTVETFLCDVVTTVARNMPKYLEQLHSLLPGTYSDGEFGPAVVCALDSFSRLAGPNAKGLAVPQRAAISAYLSRVLLSLLAFQMYPHSLATVIFAILYKERLDCRGYEWKPLQDVEAAVLGDRAAAKFPPLELEGPSRGSDMMVVVQRQTVNRIVALSRRGSILTREWTEELEACFSALTKLLISAAELRDESGKQVLKDALAHPELLKAFLADDPDGGSKNIRCGCDTLEPLDKHILDMIEAVNSANVEEEEAEHLQACCRSLVEKALSRLKEELKDGLARRKTMKASTAALTSYNLWRYTDGSSFVGMVHELSRKVTKSSEPYQLLWCDLAASALKQAEMNWSEHRDKLINIYGAVVGLATSASSVNMMAAMQVMASAEPSLLGSSTPLEVLGYCVRCDADKVKAEMAHLLVRESSVFLEEFGRLLVAGGVSHEQLMLLLPAGRVFLSRAPSKEAAAQVGSVYFKALSEELSSDSGNHDLAGLTEMVEVLRLCFSARKPETEERRRLFEALLPNNDGRQRYEPGTVSVLVDRTSRLLRLLLKHDGDVDPAVMSKYVSDTIAKLEVLYRDQQSNDEGLRIIEEQLLGIVCEGCARVATEGMIKATRKLAKIVLKFRFSESVPMLALERMVSMLLKTQTPSETVKKMAAEVRELVVSHSLFVSSLLRKDSASTSASLSSVLSVLGAPEDWELNGRSLGSTTRCQRFALVRLLRVLQSLSGACGGDDVKASRQLFSLLMAAYDASMIVVDQELLGLMHEMEEARAASFAEMDYLWGNAALERWTEMAKNNDDGDELMQDSQQELNKRRFKEALDPKRCAMTVLHFPQATKGLEKQCIYSEAYDPAFVIPFGSHGLSIGCIEPEDLVTSGLLAVALSSMSSPCEALRKSGYELLGQFTAAMEATASFKGKAQITSLLVYIRNAVTQPCQRLPSVITVFAAEASFVLMHPQNPLYMQLSRFIVRAPAIDLESVPLFQAMFTSGNEMTWMLRLLLAGLVSPDDGLIYRRQFIPEILMSVCTSAMSDGTTKKWVLQILKRGAAIPSFAKSLLVNNGVLLWLVTMIRDEKCDPEDCKIASEVLGLLLRKKTKETKTIEELCTLALESQGRL